MKPEAWELPDEWIWTNLEEITQPVSKIDPSKDPTRRFLYVDVSSVSNESFEILSPRPTTGSEAPTRARQLISVGDVLFSMVRPYLLNVALVRKSDDGNIASTAFCVLRSNGCVDPTYLYFWLLSGNFISRLLPEQRGIAYP